MKRKGLSLAELVLAVGLLAGVLILMVSVMGNGLRWQANSRGYSLAYSAGRDLLERIREGGASVLPAPQIFDGRIGQASVGAPPFPPAPYPKVVTDHETFSYVVKVSLVQPGLFSVQVDTYWDNQRKVSLETYVR